MFFRDDLVILGVKLERISEFDFQGDTWDEGNGAPDIFLTIKLNQENTFVLTDTLVDFTNGQEGVFFLTEEVVIERSDSVLAIVVLDEDYNSSIPATLQSDDVISRYDSRPWGLPNPLWDREVVRLGNRGTVIELVIEREF